MSAEGEGTSLKTLLMTHTVWVTMTMMKAQMPTKRLLFSQESRQRHMGKKKKFRCRQCSAKKAGCLQLLMRKPLSPGLRP